MGNVYRETYTKPLPKDAELITKNDERIAQWRDNRGRKKTAPVRTGKDGSLKISDFGVARMTDNNRTKTGIVLGTPMYMSPEQLAAENLTGHSDLFSLGVTLYELLIGEVPFKAGNIAALMAKITTHDPAPIAGRRTGLPPSVDAVLAKAMTKRPEDRFY